MSIAKLVGRPWPDFLPLDLPLASFTDKPLHVYLDVVAVARCPSDTGNQLNTTSL